MSLAPTKFHSEPATLKDFRSLSSCSGSPSFSSASRNPTPKATGEELVYGVAQKGGKYRKSSTVKKNNSSKEYYWWTSDDGSGSSMTVGRHTIKFYGQIIVPGQSKHFVGIGDTIRVHSGEDTSEVLIIGFVKDEGHPYFILAGVKGENDEYAVRCFPREDFVSGPKADTDPETEKARALYESYKAERWKVSETLSPRTPKTSEPSSLVKAEQLQGSEMDGDYWKVKSSDRRRPVKREQTSTTPKSSSKGTKKKKRRDSTPKSRSKWKNGGRSPPPPRQPANDEDKRQKIAPSNPVTVPVNLSQVPSNASGSGVNITLVINYGGPAPQ